MRMNDVETGGNILSFNSGTKSFGSMYIYGNIIDDVRNLVQDRQHCDLVSAAQIDFIL